MARKRKIGRKRKKQREAGERGEKTPVKLFFKKARDGIPEFGLPSDWLNLTPVSTLQRHGSRTNRVCATASA